MFFMNRENLIRDLNREQFVDKSTIIHNEENKIKPVFKN